MKAPSDLFKAPPDFHYYFKNLFAEVYPVTMNSVKNITFIVTEDCNLQCSYCYEGHKNHSNRMSWPVARHAIEYLLSESLKDEPLSIDLSKAIVLDFIGGEPFLEIELIDQIVSFFKIRALQLGHPWGTNYMLSFSTNGLLYKDPKVQDFMRRNRGRISCGISIDGHQELHDRCRVDVNGHGSYQRVCESVKQWVKDYERAATKVTFTSESLPDIAQAIEHLFRLGIRDVSANVVFEDVWKEGDDRLFYQQLVKLADVIIEKGYYQEYTCTLFDKSIGQLLSEDHDSNYCGGDGTMLAIGTDGRLYPCLRFAEFATSKEGFTPVVIGDIYKGLDFSSPLLGELQALTRRCQSTDECFYCPVGSGCAWCTAFNYECYGTPSRRATYICKMHKARVLANHYFWNRLYHKLSYEDMFKNNLSDDDLQRLGVVRGTTYEMRVIS